MNLSQKKILLGLTGGIAAYKVADLCRQLVKAGAEVRVVMTSGAKAFITPLTLQALSGNPVHDDLLDPSAEAAMGHIELAKWPDLIVIAPASADFIARATVGMANDLLSTLCVASAKPIALVPAMNQQMWANAATQDNIQTASKRGMHIWGPASGEQACGDVGLGRMIEPLDIAQKVDTFFNHKPLKGQHWVITAGPTVEKIDPVRFLTNRSSGKMGYSIAKAAADLGAKVTLVSGPVSLSAPNGVQRLMVESAQSMLDAVTETTDKADVFIACAAVSDYRAKDISEQKMKKKADSGLSLELEQNPDILKWVATNRSCYCVGFAAETQNVDEYAKAKMQRKGIEMICANDVSRTDIGFSSDHNELRVFHLIKDQIEMYPLGPMLKSELSLELVELINSVR
ncbi:bifunctional phosphopantothenoylcysteine decarboxylase/phosphopantothenate--cysteine ligase CoaBC [Kangiella sp. HZ709]|uniref:bifunctional phosphopantothenoylcysteine decarboxylase/phosphopantothenate--cysteine ligase CoaBC n=1 Tax=Kangiella sp. HZ709 TaxID=2666328 RepID=UPI0012AF83A9|nr:bifunctional phosphopantothenoylcysteine decarboxylase/phosphopantothenate--cysteine ligase CoaBC [Kangiella sp. HZ709]MRX27623.1 bifunctional phosphopantothenoylcysteine decarboxylase/phosphopantothenate--cysteine ligase CoaBC [Kangiella sp. HZ709]